MNLIKAQLAGARPRQVVEALEKHVISNEEAMVEEQMICIKQPVQAGWLSNLAVPYIQQQRESFTACSRPLRSQHFERMSAHFSRQDLERARFCNIFPARVANPGFYPELRALGIANLPDFAAMTTYTFDNLIVCREPFTPGLLFHELVHVVQYRLLGIARYATFYIDGFLAGGSHHAIPLEVCAQQMEERFLRCTGRIDVEREIANWLESGRFQSAD